TSRVAVATSGVSKKAGRAAAGLGGVVVLAALLVLGSQWFLGTETGREFLGRYPGQYQQPDVPTGYPWWLNWAHFFNAFLMVLVIKTGIQIRRETKPEAHWTPKWNRKRRISLTIWTHNALDLLWVLNGVVFVILLAATGYWSRVVPTSWDAFPNALSAVLQYLSLDWPTAGEWAHYNSAQELAYFTTIFIAAPLAIATGVRMSGLWPDDRQALNKAFPLPLARAVHFPVMVYFVVFIAIHIILVFATDALRNLNQIYTGQDATNWTGFWLFVLSLVVIIGGALATRATIMAPVASLFGRVGR
ncbi:cytochrome b/b6 domain-containing protein, partial [Nesterenkonia haasae]|uniref:cytochrome b/b6 domain-containing protein n=1 Tax=Nesterenkonia haasae TaxID=2587813 RepID=UPI00192E8E8F